MSVATILKLRLSLTCVLPKFAADVLRDISYQLQRVLHHNTSPVRRHIRLATNHACSTFDRLASRFRTPRHQESAPTAPTLYRPSLRLSLHRLTVHGSTRTTRPRMCNTPALATALADSSRPVSQQLPLRSCFTSLSSLHCLLFLSTTHTTLGSNAIFITINSLPR